MIDEDTTEARALLTRLMGDEPPMTLTSKTVLRKARTNTVIQRSAAMTGVAVAVATVMGVTMLARSGTAPGQDVTAASTAPTPMTNVLTELSPPCVAGTPGCAYVKDDRSNRLSEDLNAAIGTILPKGMAVRPDPMVVGAGQEEPFTFGQLAGVYVASADAYDAAGHGSLGIALSNKPNPATCAEIGDPMKVPATLELKMIPAFAVVCTDHTLADGTVAAVSVYTSSPELKTSLDWRKVMVDARKPDGTTLHLVSDNNPPVRLTDPPTHVPGRPDAPLSGDDLLKLVQLPALKY